MTKPDRWGVAASVPLRVVVDDSALAVDVVPASLRRGALDRPVRWAHVCELPDPAPYLLGGELLLTAGVNLPGDEAVDDYVRGLQAAGVSALGFGVTPPFHAELPPALEESCVRHGLTLLVIPPSTPFLAISRAVVDALAEAAQREQHRIADVREALTRAASEGSAELIGELAQRLPGRVALVGPDDLVVAESGFPPPLPGKLGELVGRVRAGSGIRSATTDLSDGTVVVAQPISPQATASHVLAVGVDHRFGSGDRAIIGVGAALLGLVGRTAADAPGLGEAVTSLVLAKSDAAGALGDILGTGECHVVEGVAHGRGPEGVSDGDGWLRTRLSTPLVHLRQGKGFTALVADSPKASTLDDLLAHGWLTVVGPARSANRLAEHRSDIAALLQRAQASGRPVTAEGGETRLGSLVGEDAARGFARDRLGPVRALDESRGDDVVIRTLRAWLAHHGSWDRTAASLGMHRNSVRNRIGQAERALGADLADPEVRMELWFALRWDT
jgi:hypothetical protein